MIVALVTASSAAFWTRVERSEAPTNAACPPCGTKYGATIVGIIIGVASTYVYLQSQKAKPRFCAIFEFLFMLVLLRLESKNRQIEACKLQIEKTPQRRF